MPNGDDITPEEYQRFEAVLSLRTEEWADFAKRTGAEYTLWFHGRPQRRFLYVRQDAIHRLIIVAPLVCQQGRNDESGRPTFLKRDAPEFGFGTMAWKDENGRRKSWYREIERRATLPQSQDLRAMLQQMLELVNSIGEEDLT